MKEGYAIESPSNGILIWTVCDSEKGAKTAFMEIRQLAGQSFDDYAKMGYRAVRVTIAKDTPEEN